MNHTAKDSPEFIRLPLEGGGLALIDEDDEELVRSLGEWSSTGPNWSWYSDGGRGYELRRNRRSNWHDWHAHSRVAFIYMPEGGGTTVYLHDLIMGAREGQEVYPANGDGLDCRKS